MTGGATTRLSCADPPRRLRYVTNATGEWVVTELGSDGSGETALIMDDDGALRFVACGGWDRDWVRYGTNATGEWTVEDVDAGDQDSCTLARDRNGLLQIMYDGLLSDMRIGWNDGGEWDLDFVDLAESRLGEMRIDQSDTTQIVYTGPVGGEGVRYALGAPGDWQVEVITDLTQNPYDVCLQVGGGGEPHVAWTDSLTSELIYAYCR
jgi:hypothetical protein